MDNMQIRNMLITLLLLISNCKVDYDCNKYLIGVPTLFFFFLIHSDGTFDRFYYRKGLTNHSE